MHQEENKMKQGITKSAVSFLFTALLMTSVSANAEGLTLKELVKEVKATSTTESAHNKEREQRFLADFNEQAGLLKAVKADVAAKEATRDSLKAEFDANEAELGEQQTLLQQRTGDLGELFGVFKQVTSDTQSMMYDSPMTAQHPERLELVGALVDNKEVPTIAEIESLWNMMLDEIVGSGEVTKFTSTVVQPDGKQYDGEVVRVGNFNLVSGDKYLNYQPESGQIIELSRQPTGATRATAEDLSSAAPGEVVGFSIDPSRGVLLSLLVQSPNLMERVEQGKEVGYAIIAVGVIGLLIALYRFLALARVGMKIKKQQKNMDQFDVHNPLGRVLNAFYENQNLSADVISRKLDEVIFKDASELRSGIQTIKVLAAIAPLMGLLGTVTGMIGTFQAITLFGTGDPKLMAGGISQALVTTVLGLVASIPLLLVHSLLTTRATALTKVLGEQAAGMVATQAEKLEKAKKA
jgi:biopolymer transport protein ExbB